LNIRILDAVSLAYAIAINKMYATYLRHHKDVMPLLITNRKASLSFFVLIGKGIKVLDGVVLGDGKGELDVGFCVFMAGLGVSACRLRVVWESKEREEESRGAYENPCIIWERSKRDVQSVVHLLAGTFEEFTAACGTEALAPKEGGKGAGLGHTTVEEGVAGKDGFLVAILHEPADAILRMARGVKCFDGDAAEVEGLAVGGCLGHLLAVLAADDIEGLA
jgi:hypothetical protein